MQKVGRVAMGGRVIMVRLSSRKSGFIAWSVIASVTMTAWFVFILKIIFLEDVIEVLR